MSGVAIKDASRASSVLSLLRSKLDKNCLLHTSRSSSQQLRASGPHNHRKMGLNKISKIKLAQRSSANLPTMGKLRQEEEGRGDPRQRASLLQGRKLEPSQRGSMLVMRYPNRLLETVGPSKRLHYCSFGKCFTTESASPMTQVRLSRCFIRAS